MAAAITWLSVAAAVIAQAAPVLGAPTARALGAPDGEGASHLWGLVTTAEGLGRAGPFVRASALVNAPAGVRLDLVDPLHLLFIAPGRALGGLGGAVLAWNLLHPACLLLLAWGAHRLAAALGATALGRAVAVAGALGTPYLWGGLPLGRSELLGCLLLPLLLSLMVGIAGRGGGGDDRPGGAPAAAGPAALVFAALLLAAIGLSGWQALMLCALALLPAGLLLVVRAPVPSRALRDLVGVALGAALLLLPMLFAHLGTAPWWTARLHEAVALGPQAAGTSLLAAMRLDAPRPPMGTAVAPYPGLVLLVAAIAALRRPPARPWALLAVVLVGLSLGPRIRLPGGGRADLGPAWLLVRYAPPWGGLVDWARLSLVAGPLCAVAGGLALSRRGRLAAVLVALLALVDGMSWRLDAPGAFDVAPPPDVAAAYAALPPGPVLELPGVAPDERAHLADNDRSMLWALSHRHPVTAAPSPLAPAMLGRSLLLQLHRAPPPRPDDPCAATEGARLHALGFRGVVLIGDRVEPRRRRPLLDQVARVLGPAAGRTGAVAWWILAAGDTGPPGCSAPPRGG